MCSATWTLLEYDPSIQNGKPKHLIQINSRLMITVTLGRISCLNTDDNTAKEFDRQQILYIYIYVHLYLYKKV